jgi:hypothetical protein
MSHYRRALFTGSAALFSLFIGTTASAATVTQVGSPKWTVADMHMFAAPLGNPGNGYADFLTTGGTFLTPPNHVPHAQLGLGPGAPHAGPYNNEMGANIAAAGYTETTTFTASQWGGDLGIWFTYAVLPDGSTTGSSPDFASGPIIPNNLFPLKVEIDTFRNGVLYDSTGVYTVPALNDPTLTPSFAVDGASHYPFFLVDNASFAADPSLPLTGNYEYRFEARDARGQGYDIVQAFQVVADPTGGGNPVPLPPAMWAGILTAALGLPAARRFRKR